MNENVPLDRSLAGEKLKAQWKSTGPPDIMADEIEYHEKIGGGCFGHVFRGTCRGKEVAVKKLFKQDLDEKTLSDFKKEVEIMSQLRHPNVLLFMGACTEPGNMAIVTEMCTKGNVEDLLQDKSVSMSLYGRMKMVKDVAQGMCWLHESKPSIIHRDMKPSNLLIDENGVVKVCDFGLSAIKPKSIAKLKDEDSVPGTPLWMAPEVLLGKSFDASSDVYSFGIVLWEIYTKKEVFPNMSTFAQFKRSICFKHERPPIPSKCPARLRKLMESCWHKDSTQRPTFREIIGMVNEIIVDVAVTDPLGNQFWKKNFLGKEKLTWEHFSTAFAKFLKLPIPLTTDIEDQFRYLRYIVGTRKANALSTSPPSVVDLEDFGRLLNWFGPLTEGTTFLEKLRNIMRCPWFHGDIDSATAEKLLLGRKKGCFLVRLSTSKSGMFTISKVASKGINHQRVQNKPGVGFSLKITHRKKTQVISDNVPLDDFIGSKKVSSALTLKTACPGSKYGFLYGDKPKFESGATANGYVVDDASDSDE